MLTSPSRPIIVGVSGSPASRAALRWAADEAHRRDAPLIVVRAWQPAQIAYYAYDSGYSDRAHQHAAAVRELAATLHKVFGAQLPPGLVTDVVEGLPERVLAERSAGADMLVLGSTSAPTVVGRSLGAVIRSCLSRAHCPVVVIGPEGEAGGRSLDTERAAASIAG